MENILFKDFGTFLNTSKGEQYEIKKVVIFKDNQEKIIANYFLDNFKNDYQFKINGDINRKLKIDLSLNTNFVVKSEKQDSWNDKTQYDLYLNGDLNNYIFNNLALEGKQLNIKYSVNGFNCSHCIGWNQKESNNAKYKKFDEAYKKINSYSLDNEEMEENIKNLLKTYREYKKAKEIEKTYTAEDYKKMSLSSGTSEEENQTMLKNNGFEI
jgi:hypothetical protein